MCIVVEWEGGIVGVVGWKVVGVGKDEGVLYGWED